MFITIEGGQGSGKDTQQKILVDVLRNKGYDVVSTREPGGTMVGEQIRNVFLNPDLSHMTAECELYLVSACRVQHIDEVIRPSLKAGKIVVCNCYTASTWAYQYYGRGLDLGLMRHVMSKVHTVKPDLNILLDVDPSVGMKRKFDQKLELDRIEQDSMVFYTKVREGYIQYLRTCGEPYEIINASQDIKNVFSMIQKRLRQYGVLI